VTGKSGRREAAGWADSAGQAERVAWRGMDRPAGAAPAEPWRQVAQQPAAPPPLAWYGNVILYGRRTYSSHPMPVG